MKVVRYAAPDGELATGLVVAGGVVEASARVPSLADFSWALSHAGRAALDTLAEVAADSALADLQLVTPVDRRGRLFCVGRNFPDHVAETGAPVEPQPRVFLKTHESLVPPGGTIRRPVASVQFDYEGEVAVVIGEPGASLRPDEALGHVAAYTCFQDGSIRDYQDHTTTAGKNFDGSGSMGPWLVTADEIEDARELEITTRLNGEVVQNATLDQMIYSIPDVLSYISAISALRTGDVVSMGTPAGVAARRSPPRWLRDGDELDVDVSRIGRLHMHVEDALSGAEARQAARGRSSDG